MDYKFTDKGEKMNLKDILVLTGKTSLEGKFLASKGLEVENIWKNNHFSIRKFSVLRLLNLQYLLYGFSNEQIKQYNKIILNETDKMSAVAKDILKWNPNADLKVYMWNIVRPSSVKEVLELKKMGVEVYTFEKDDCKKYNLSYNPQLYPHLYTKSKNINIEYDCYFCAADKNRINKLIEIKNAIEKYNISYKFRVLLKKHKKYDFDKEAAQGIFFMDKTIPYEQLINETFLSKSILEIVQEGQNGFTWRVFESIFYDKKLITNNKNLKYYNFYHPNNIFILNNNYDEIKSFLEKPYVQIDKKIKNEYTYKSWLNNFFNGI